MSMTEGDMLQYKEIKQSSVGEYIYKLDNFVRSIEQAQKTERSHRAVKAARKF